MLLFCDARAIDQTMALKSLALVSEDDVHSFTASSMDDPAVVRDSLRKFIALVTAADHGKTPVVAVPPVPMSPETTTSSELLKVASAHEQSDFNFFHV